MARNRRRKSKPTFKMPQLPARLLENLARAGAAVAVIVAVGWAALALMDRPIQSIRVTGSFERVTAIQVEAALGDIGDRGFLATDLDRLQRRVEALPWVDQAVIGRSWPSELVVNIVEQVPAARWKEQGLLNTRGELFIENARHIPAELPHLGGPEGAEKRVAAVYLELRDELTREGHGLAAVQLDERGAWRIRLASGMDVRFGRDHFQRRLGRFLHVVSPLLAARNETAAYVDLRYGRGFSIAWTAGDDNSDRETRENDNDV